MRVRALALAIVPAASVIVPASAQAAITVNIDQFGEDVVANTSGSLDLTGLVPDPGPFYLSVGVIGKSTYVGTGVPGAPVRGYSGFAGPSQIGPGMSFKVSYLGVGTPFGLNYDYFGPPYVFVAPDYVSGGAIASSATFFGRTIASLGLSLGTYIYTSSADTITINIGPAVDSVPEPATWAMFVGGVGAIGAGMRRRRRQPGFARLAT